MVLAMKRIAYEEIAENFPCTKVIFVFTFGDDKQFKYLIYKTLQLWKVKMVWAWHAQKPYDFFLKLKDL